MSKAATKQETAFSGLGDILAGGFDQDLANSDHMIKIPVSEIEWKEQVRDKDQMEDDENTLDDLGESLAKRQAQNIIVRPNPNFPHASSKRYEGVAGERRARASLKKGIPDLWALVAELTDEEAEELQLAENIHRKNLTQLEEAKRIQRDLDKLGSVDAVLAKHNKSRAWLSKIIALLHLPEQAKRLVKENISADIEVINTVKTIEKADPKKAKALVDELKASRGKESARHKVAAVKNEVKPSKKQAAKSAAGNVATARDLSHQEPGAGTAMRASSGTAAAKGKRAVAAPPRVLEDAYMALYEGGKKPQGVLDGWSDAERDEAEAYLHNFYEAGKQAIDVARTVMEGFRNGGFSTDGANALALIAYLQGADARAKFSVLNILGCAKP